MLRRTTEFKELTNKPYPNKTKEWTAKILKLGLDPRINIFPDKPGVLLDFHPKGNRFFYESWDSHTISDIHDGLEKLVTYFLNKNKIFTLADENNKNCIKSYKIVEGAKLIDILIDYPNYYIPCSTTNHLIKFDTSDMARMQQISKDIPLKIIEKGFLETLSLNNTKYKYTQLLPSYSRPELAFPHSDITNIPINLNLEDDEIIAYVLKAKEEFKEHILTIKHPLELIGNKYDEAKKPTSEKELPAEKHKRRVAVADAFYLYDLFKILDPYFAQKKKELRDIRDKKVKLLKREYKNMKNAKKEKEDAINSLKDSYKDEIKQYNKGSLNFTLHVVTKLSLHKVERYLKYMKEYIDHKRYAELITEKTTPQKNS